MLLGDWLILSGMAMLIIGSGGWILLEWVAILPSLGRSERQRRPTTHPSSPTPTW